MSSQDLSVSEELPSPQEYVDLRAACGLKERTVEAATLGLPRSLFSVTIRNKKGELVGMGRVIGDLGCHVQITDIAVHPEFQKRGLGALIMDRIMAFVKKECPRSCFVNLFADVDFLYQKYGFIYPSKAKGMYLDWNRVS